MLDTDDLALWYALNRLMINYWADVDSNAGAQAHEFYLPDALYAVRNNRFEGEQKIRAFYARRRQRGRTTTRHLVDNLRVFRDDARSVRAVGVMSLYRADGSPPFQGARPPAMVARFRGAVRARRRPAVAFSITRAANDFRRQRRPNFVDHRPATPVSATRA
jgi:SnoaL-like domain